MSAVRSSYKAQHGGWGVGVYPHFFFLPEPSLWYELDASECNPCAAHVSESVEGDMLRVLYSVDGGGELDDGWAEDGLKREK